jgi:hypothetical protein
VAGHGSDEALPAGRILDDGAGRTRFRSTELHDQDDDAPPSNRGALLALGVVALLILGGLWLTHVLGGAAATQDCLASGRTNCAPVAAPGN